MVETCNRNEMGINVMVLCFHTCAVWDALGIFPIPIWVPCACAFESKLVTDVSSVPVPDIHSAAPPLYTKPHPAEVDTQPRAIFPNGYLNLTRASLQPAKPPD